jgi:iron complex outermembrane receptor protein
MRGNRRTRIAGLLLLGITIAGARAGAAADAPADTVVIPVEGVTVTGSRMPESLLRSPAALTLVPRSRFESTRQISLADGLTGIPGVFAQSRAGAQDVRITIRGYGARGNGERSNAGSMRGIRVMTDGIPVTEPDGRTSLDLVDLGGTDRIEVLRSNGSALYGNASGGVVNLRTSTAFGGPFAELTERAGAYGFHREQGHAGLALGRSRNTLSVFNSALDGWRDHSQSSTTLASGRVMAPMDDHSKLRVLLDYASNFNRYPGALTQVQMDVDPQQADSVFAARDERRFNRIGRLGLAYDRDLTAAQDLSLGTWAETKVLQRSERNRFRDFNRYHVGGSATWQLRHAMGSDKKLTWMAGADDQYQDGSIQFYDLTPSGGRGTTLIANKREGANSFGGFAQGDLVVDEVWSFRIAARYDNLWYISEDRIDPTINATKHFTHVTPKGSIARFIGRHTVYASVGGGVEAPAFNEIDPPPPLTTSLNPFLEPMISTSYELGGRGLLAGGERGAGRLSYDAALYWIEVTNDIIPFNGGAYFFTAGKSRRRGGELGLDWTPLKPLTVNGALTVSNNEYLDYTVNNVSFAGNEVAGLPDVTFDGAARYRVVPGLTLSGTYRHVGDYFANDANTASAKAFDLLGLQVDYARPLSFGAISVFVAAENLTDENYVASVFINGINGKYYEPGLPSNLSGGLTLSFR